MSTIMEKLDQEHGTNYWVMLDSLGGHPTEIINKYHNFLSYPSHKFQITVDRKAGFLYNIIYNRKVRLCRV